ncbi:TPA: hypothetical protein EYP27_04175 [Candidatus Bathyarchaeota archaeon]|nr:hypothetical protein [Candidatus Bathyarchaeota archaeon]
MSANVKIKLIKLTAIALILFAVVPSALPLKGQPTQELAFDDGSADFGFICSINCVAAVKFSVPSQMRVLKLKYYIWGEITRIRVHVLDSNARSIYSKEVLPSSSSPHWLEVDLSDANVIVNGEFFVGFEWIEVGPETGHPMPWLGVP